MDKNKGHFCYGCNEYFHDSNPSVTEHKGCKGDKELGACVDKREFYLDLKTIYPETNALRNRYCFDEDGGKCYEGTIGIHGDKITFTNDYVLWLENKIINNSK